MKIVESLDGVEAMWCTPDQQVITSSGWDSRFKGYFFKWESQPEEVMTC